MTSLFDVMLFYGTVGSVHKILRGLKIEKLNSFHIINSDLNLRGILLL